MDLRWKLMNQSKLSWAEDRHRLESFKDVGKSPRKRSIGLYYLGHTPPSQEESIQPTIGP